MDWFDWVGKVVWVVVGVLFVWLGVFWVGVKWFEG